MSLSWSGVTSENVAAVWLLYHLTDHLSPVRIQELARQLDMAPRVRDGRTEEYAAYMQRIRDTYGIILSRNYLEHAAFTGAVRSRMGRFELAHGGTIFLDEIGDMSPTLQVKVLRVIQEKQFERIGGMKTIDVDVRIITATNQDLEKAVMEKTFREDLFYRINVIPIHLPSLRERKVDIPVLTNHFLREFNRLKKKNVEKLMPEAMDCLMKYQWPGNVRELQNLMEMLVVMKEYGTIEIADLPDKMRHNIGDTAGASHEIEIPESGLDLNETICQFEKDLLRKALDESGGVKNRAAKLLKLNRTTLVEKLKRYQLG